MPSCVGFRYTGEKANLRVIAVHSAGADASMYNKLFSNINNKENLDLISLQLPGRSYRFKEPLGSSFSEVVESIYVELRSLIKDNIPTIFLGYSMGAAISFELALKFQISGLPVHKLILCARYAPSYEHSTLNRGNLSDEELKNIILDLGGTPTEILNNKALMDYYIKIIRSDFSLIDSYKRSGDFKVKCPIYALAGVYDKEAPLKGVEKWSEFTTCKFKLFLFEAGHFFIHSQYDSFLDCVNKIIKDQAED